MSTPVRILHLEADREDAEIVKGVLEAGGIQCRITRVEGRDDFRAALDATAFDVILADFTLPDYDGLSALKVALQRCPDVPFIFVSRTLGEEVAVDALKSGAADYVLKERPARIVSSVQQALHEARARAERVHSEQQLRRSEALLAEGQRISHTGSWDWIVSSGKITWSDEQYRILGFEPGRAEPSVDLFLTAVHPEDRARVQYTFGRAVRAKRPFTLNHRVVLPGGAIRHVRSVGRPVPAQADDSDEFVGTTTDITERAQAESGSKRSEECYALAMGAAGEGHWDWNLVTSDFYASPRLLELFALPPCSTFANSTEFLAQWPIDPDDRPMWEEAVAAHLAGATGQFDLEIRMIPRGETRWIHLKGLCSRDPSGAPVRWAGTARDITERKRMEIALRQSSERYALAVEAAGEGHSDWNLETGEFDISPRLLEICGFPPGTTFKDREDWLERFPFHPEDRPKWEKGIAAHFAGEESRFHIELRIVVRGETRWVRLVFLCCRDARGKPVRWTGSTTDVTDRKRTEEELRARQEMLDLAQKVARAVAFQWRIGTGVAENRWSQDLDAMHGLAPGTYDGTFETWKKLVCADDCRAVEEAMARAMESGYLAVEYRVDHPDGAVHWLQVKGRMFFDEAGQPARIVGFVIDITERRRAEEEFRRLETRLRQSQRLEAMGALAGGIAHDFNNILGAILGYGERALQDTTRGSRLRRDLESILVAGERGRALVDRVLMFSRSGVGERVAVHVEGVVREALDLVAAKLPTDVAIDSVLRGGRAAMLGDPTQIHQVLMNLATNAIQAMPSGGTLRVSLETVSVDAPRVATIGTIGAADYVVLQVADTGSGIAPEMLDRIFDPFFTTKDVGVGTGLGLSLVHGIVMDVGGAIDLTSAVGSGSTFTVYLPRAGDAAEDSVDAEQALPQGDGQRVLCVDDEEPLVRLVTETLEELGYAPVGFTSSAAALEAFRADPKGFDAVITDERMPGMSGSGLIREVRGIRRSVPILLVSGYVGGPTTNRGCDAGATEVLKKPLSTRELATSLARVLQI